MSTLWDRIEPWLPGGGRPDDGDAALRALADVADARRLLEQAELSAVRTARLHRRSWTEIATMLTITRQSAWERWRELDDAGDATSAGAPDDRAAAAADALADTTAGTVSDLGGRKRRRRDVEVPDLVGYTAADAVGILTRMGLDAVSATPGLELLESSDDLRPTVVVRQYPDSGTRIRTASTVKLWLERGDGEAGVREPRRPGPPPRVAQGERDERVDAVG